MPSLSFSKKSKPRSNRMFRYRPDDTGNRYVGPGICACVSLFAVLIALGGCHPGDIGSSGGAILFSAASSTTDAVERIRDDFVKQTGYKVELDSGSTSRLATQIKNGGDVDLFLSASEKWADEVTTNQRGKSRVLERVDLLSNRLVVVVPQDSTRSVANIEDLLDSAFEEVALANPDALVPAGVYAKEALENLGLWEKLRPKLIYGDNVRTTLTYVESGSVPAGIVYATDAVASKRVRVAFEIDPSLHKQVRYPLLLLRHSGHHPGAAELFDYLTGPEAAKVFTELGFTVLPIEEDRAKGGEVSAENPS